jgi:hypothetical protein
LEDIGTERDQSERVKSAELAIKDLVAIYPATRNDLQAFQEFRQQLIAIQLQSKIVAVLKKGPWTSLDLAETIVWRKLPPKFLREFQNRCQDDEWKSKYTRSLYQLSKWIGEQVITKSTIDKAEETLRNGMFQGANEEIYVFAQRVEDQAVLAGMAGRDFSGELPRAFIKGLVKVVRGVNFQYDVEHTLAKGKHRLDWRKARSSAQDRWRFWMRLRKRVEKEYLAQVPTRDDIHDRGYGSPSTRPGASTWQNRRFSKGAVKLAHDEQDQAFFVKGGSNYRGSDRSRSPARYKAEAGTPIGSVGPVIKSLSPSFQVTERTICYRCGGKGHTSHTCTFSGDVCWNCHQPGHMIAACKAPIRNQEVLSKLGMPKGYTTTPRDSFKFLHAKGKVDSCDYLACMFGEEIEVCFTISEMDDERERMLDWEEQTETQD